MTFESYLFFMFLWTYSSGSKFCYTGSSRSEKIYNGELNTQYQNVCTSQNITFTCKLLDPPDLNRTIGFLLKTRSTGVYYIPMEEARVTVLNKTVSQMTIYNISMETKTSDVSIYVKCSYWQKFGETDCILELGDTSSARIYPRPEPVKGFNCIVFNNKWMNCSWDFGKDYGTHLPNITFLWKVPSYSSSWNPCPSNNSINEGHCIWNSTRDGYFINQNITARLILQQPCGENGENVTSDFPIDTSKIVKSDSVVGLTATPVNSTCISVSWKTRDSEWFRHLEQKVTFYQTQKNKTKEVEFFNTKETENNRTICKLRPYTKYEFSVSIRPTSSRYFSDERITFATTFPAKPSASPEVTDGGYSWQPKDCQGYVRRLVCTFWKPIKDDDENGQLTGLVGLFIPKTAALKQIREDWEQDVTYGCTWLMCNTSYTFHILASNEKGNSEKTSELEIPSATLGLRQPRFMVESTSNSVNVTWTHPNTQDARGFTVAWCRNKDGKCENKKRVYWKRVPSYKTDTVIQIDPSNAAQDFLYGVSALSDQGSSGFDWQDCVYLKHAKPSREPQNVIVTNGPDDNTLIVTWDKLMCKSDQPYIDMYNIQYRNREDGSRKSVDVSALAEARLVMENLKEDATYEITVRALTKDGQYGPESQQQTGTPVNRSLKPGSIVGITMAVLVCVIFAGVGCVCAIRRCKNKAERAIQEAGKITIPTVTGLDLSPSMERKESYDSGYDKTSTSGYNKTSNNDGTCYSLKFRSPACVSHSSSLACCSRENIGCEACIRLQPDVAKISNFHSGLVPSAHDNSGYVLTNKVDNSVPLSTAVGYVPHCYVQSVSHKLDEQDSKERVSTLNSFKVIYAFGPPESDCSTHTCSCIEEETDMDNANGNLQIISTYQLNRYSPKHFRYPTSDAYVHSSHEDIHLTDVEEKTEDTSQEYVDETYAKDLLQEIIGVPNKPITVESQTDGYVDHAALKTF